VINPK